MGPSMYYVIATVCSATACQPVMIPVEHCAPVAQVAVIVEYLDANKDKHVERWTCTGVQETRK